MTLDEREVATVLAALLYWREENVPHGREIQRPYLEAVGKGHVEPLSEAEIHRLSERLRRECGGPSAPCPA